MKFLICLIKYNQLFPMKQDKNVNRMTKQERYGILQKNIYYMEKQGETG